MVVASEKQTAPVSEQPLDRVTAIDLPHEADDLIRLAAGKVFSTMLEVAVDMGLFKKLAGREVPADDLAELWEMPGPSARLMAQSLTNVGMLRYRDDKVSLAPVAERLLTGDLMIERELRKIYMFQPTPEQLKYRLLNPPVQIWYQLRDEGEVVDDSAVMQDTQKYLRNWRGGMHEERLEWGEQLAAQHDFGRYRSLLDLGGASGGWSMGLRRRWPHLEAIVFDIPEAAAVAERKIEEAGAEDSMRAVAGSVFTDPLPEGFDIAFMANFLFVWSKEDIRKILAKVHDALPPGGTIFIWEPFFEDDWTGNIVNLFYGFVLSGVEGKSAWRGSYGEMEELLAEAGFSGPERGRDFLIATKS